MKICGWILTYANKKKKESHEESELRIRNNNKRAIVAEALLKLLYLTTM